jgi:hypothetical protein
MPPPTRKPRHVDGRLYCPRTPVHGLLAPTLSQEPYRFGAISLAGGTATRFPQWKTIEKMARPLQLLLYRPLCDGEAPPKLSWRGT